MFISGIFFSGRLSWIPRTERRNPLSLREKLSYEKGDGLSSIEQQI